MIAKIRGFWQNSRISAKSGDFRRILTQKPQNPLKILKIRDFWLKIYCFSKNPCRFGFSREFYVIILFGFNQN